jgi:ribosomal protein L10
VKQSFVNNNHYRLFLSLIGNYKFLICINNIQFTSKDTIKFKNLLTSVNARTIVLKNSLVKFLLHNIYSKILPYFINGKILCLFFNNFSFCLQVIYNLYINKQRYVEFIISILFDKKIHKKHIIQLFKLYDRSKTKIKLLNCFTSIRSKVISIFKERYLYIAILIKEIYKLKLQNNNI